MRYLFGAVVLLALAAAMGLLIGLAGALVVGLGVRL